MIIAPVVTEEEAVDKETVQDEAVQDVPSRSEDTHAEETTTNEKSILERHKRIIELHDGDEKLSYRDIAKRLGLSKSLVGSEIQKHKDSSCSC